jgi:glycosyltransferase involved in cell wall biosynthesis
MIDVAASASVTARNRAPGRSVAALGDVMDPDCFGGSPSQFLQESRRQGFAETGWTVDVGKLRLPRLIWNGARVLQGRAPGGFQFSAAGQAAALAQIPPHLLRTDIISFHQHFPPPGPVLEAGGSISYYIDATYTQLFASYGMDKHLDPRTMRDAIDYERQAFASASRVIASQSWALGSLRSDYGLDDRKTAAILPAANYPDYPGLCQEVPAGSAGRDRPLILGFIGKDWRRKGLLFLDEVAGILRAGGWKVKVSAIGFPADQLPAGTQVETLGFIDKRLQFGPFLHSCDIGCLFSTAEAAGIAVMEFMGVGIPVAGFTVNGLADLLPPDAGFRFPVGTKAADVAEAFAGYLRDEGLQARLRANARRLAPQLRWDRCVSEFREFWETGSIASPFRLCPGPRS